MGLQYSKPGAPAYDEDIIKKFETLIDQKLSNVTQYAVSRQEQSKTLLSSWHVQANSDSSLYQSEASYNSPKHIDEQLPPPPPLTGKPVYWSRKVLPAYSDIIVDAGDVGAGGQQGVTGDATAAEDAPAAGDGEGPMDVTQEEKSWIDTDEDPPNDDLPPPPPNRTAGGNRMNPRRRKGGPKRKGYRVVNIIDHNDVCIEREKDAHRHEFKLCHGGKKLFYLSREQQYVQKESPSLMRKACDKYVKPKILAEFKKLKSEWGGKYPTDRCAWCSERDHKLHECELWTLHLNSVRYCHQAYYYCKQYEELGLFHELPMQNQMDRAGIEVRGGRTRGYIHEPLYDEIFNEWIQGMSR